MVGACRLHRLGLPSLSTAWASVRSPLPATRSRAASNARGLPACWGVWLWSLAPGAPQPRSSQTLVPPQLCRCPPGSLALTPVRLPSRRLILRTVCSVLHLLWLSPNAASSLPTPLWGPGTLCFSGPVRPLSLLTLHVAGSLFTDRAVQTASP